MYDNLKRDCSPLCVNKMNARELENSAYYDTGTLFRYHYWLHGLSSVHSFTAYFFIFIIVDEVVCDDDVTRDRINFLLYFVLLDHCHFRFQINGLSFLRRLSRHGHFFLGRHPGVFQGKG